MNDVSNKDTVAGLKIDAGWITIGFRVIVTCASLIGAYTVTAFWIKSDQHNDERYVKRAELETFKLDIATSIKHLTEIREIKLTNIENLIKTQTEIIKSIQK